MNTHESIESLSFEQSYERLEQVIASLEAGDLDLDQSIALYEEGIRLAQHCGQKLDDAQIRVTQLLATATDDSIDEELDADDELDEEMVVDSSKDR